MRYKPHWSALSASALCLVILGVLNVNAADAPKADDPIAQGKALAFDMFKGNCLACHVIAGGESPGNIAPPLVAMSVRYPDKAKLRAQIYDSRTNNPNSLMPPFGAHYILSDEEIDKVTEFVYSL